MYNNEDSKKLFGGLIANVAKKKTSSIILTFKNRDVLIHGIFIMHDDFSH